MNDTRVERRIEKILDEMRQFRRWLHAHPELGYQEHETAAAVVRRLKESGAFELRTGVGGTGVVATLRSDAPGPCVALRADMDALPIEEKTELPYASVHRGRMHACGHDGHTSMLLGAALVLAEIQDELEGPVKLIFQPAEEGGAGAEKMIEDGVLLNPTVDAVFGLHNMPFIFSHAGQIHVCPGAVMAGSGSFHIRIRGRGGHAARPQACIDPVLIGARVVESLQSLVSREIDPIRSGVVSVTTFHAGDAFNVIPGEAELTGTYRALDPEIYAWLREAIEKRARLIAEAHGASAEISVSKGFPVLVNHARTDSVFHDVVREIGRDGDLSVIEPMMLGEDFAYFAQRVPSTFWFLASRRRNDPNPPFLHHAEYDFNDDVLADGIRLHVETARRFARLWKRADAASAGDRS